MSNAFSLIAALGLSALAGWEDTTSVEPFSWECVAPQDKLELGLNLAHAVTLRETAARLPELSEGELEEVWDWHPAGRSASADVYTPAVRTGQAFSGYRGAYTSDTSHAWHEGHGNYPKGANERVVTGGDMPRGETSSRGTSATKPTEYAEGTRRYSSHSRYAQASGSGKVSSSRQRDDLGFIFFLSLLGISAVFGIPLYLKLSEEGPEHLFHWGFRHSLLSLSQYALQKSDCIHVDSVFLQALTAGKTEWVDLLLTSDWEGKSSSKIALLFIEGLIQQPRLSADIFLHISRHLSYRSGVDLNDRLTISERLHYSASADAECPCAVNSASNAQLDLERKQEKVQGKWGDEYRITWSTQPLLMIVCAMQRRDLAEFLLQEGLCSNIALLYQSAIEQGEMREAERLLAYGGSCKVALSDAVRYGVSLPVLLRLLNRYLRQGGSIYADLSYNGGGSILHHALFWQRDDVVEYLLDAYTDRERFERGAQQSLLSLAAAKNSPHLARMADLPPNWLQMLKSIDQVAEPTIWDKLRTLLDETTYCEAARYINEKDENGNTPLGRMVWAWFCETKPLHRKQHITYENGETYLRIHILLRLGADPDCGFREPLSGEWHSLVYYAAIMGNAPLVDLLATFGASVWEAYHNKALIRTVGIKPLLNQWYKRRHH